MPAHLVDKLLVVLVNDSIRCLFYLYKSPSKFIFYLKPLSFAGKLQNGSPKRVIQNQRRRNVGGVLHSHFSLHDTTIDPRIQQLIAASKCQAGGGFLRGRIDQLGKLNRKNDFNSFNIMPTKLRVRATPTKTPMKTETTPSRKGTQTPKKEATPNQCRELKRLSKQVPTSIDELIESTEAAVSRIFLN